MANLLDVSIKVPDGFKFADFDVQVMKRGLRKEGAEIAKVAKKTGEQEGRFRTRRLPGEAIRRSSQVRQEQGFPFRLHGNDQALAHC